MTGLEAATARVKWAVENAAQLNMNGPDAMDLLALARLAALILDPSPETVERVARAIMRTWFTSEQKADEAWVGSLWARTRNNRMIEARAVLAELKAMAESTASLKGERG